MTLLISLPLTNKFASPEDPEARNQFLGNFGFATGIATLLQLAITFSTSVFQKRSENQELSGIGLLGESIKQFSSDIATIAKILIGQQHKKITTTVTSTKVEVDNSALERIENTVYNKRHSFYIRIIHYVCFWIWFVALSWSGNEFYENLQGDGYLLLIDGTVFVTLVLCIPFAVKVWRNRNSVEEFRTLILSSLKADGTIPDEIVSSRTINSRLELLRLCSSNVGRVHEFWPACAALDGQALEARYNMLAVLNWCLPVLGFIGTANGLSKAVKTFPSMFQGIELSVDANAFLKTVMPALSSSFTATIVALLATVATYICISAIKSADRDNLEELDRTCLELLTAIRTPSTEGELHTIVEQLAEISKTWTEVSSNLNTAKKTVDKLEAVTSAAEATALAADGVVQSIKNVTRSAKDMNSEMENQFSQMRSVNAQARDAVDLLKSASMQVEKATKSIIPEVKISYAQPGYPSGHKK